MKNAIGDKRREENPKKPKRVHLIYQNTLLLSCSEDNLTQMPETRLAIGCGVVLSKLMGYKAASGGRMLSLPIAQWFFHDHVEVGEELDLGHGLRSPSSYKHPSLTEQGLNVTNVQKVEVLN